MARTTKKQLVARIDQLTADKRQLAGEKSVLLARTTAAEQRLGNAVAFMRHCVNGLETVFGSVTDLGHGEDDRYMRFSSNDGLAMIALNPSGELRVWDSQNGVEGFIANFDPSGELDVETQHRIRNFRSAVRESRQPGYVQIAGPVSLTARKPVQDAA